MAFIRSYTAGAVLACKSLPILQFPLNLQMVNHKLRQMQTDLHSIFILQQLVLLIHLQ